MAEFVHAFIKKHAVKGREGGEIVLDVSREEYETVGRSFIQFFVGWAVGVMPSRVRRGIAPVTIHNDEFDEFDVESR